MSPLASESVCQFLYRGTPSVVWRTQNNRSAMLSQPAHKSACQFIYRRTLAAICRTQNNRGPILRSPARELSIQKVAKYGMQDPYMLYKISCPYFIKVNIKCILLIFSKNFLVRKFVDSCFRISVTFISPARPTASPFHIVQTFLSN